MKTFYKNLKIAERRRKREEENERVQNFRDTLAISFGLEGHPKEEKLWDLAWNMGHSSGFEEVRYFYEKFSGLVK